MVLDAEVLGRANLATGGYLPSRVLTYTSSMCSKATAMISYAPHLCRQRLNVDSALTDKSYTIVAVSAVSSYTWHVHNNYDHWWVRLQLIWGHRRPDPAYNNRTDETQQPTWC
jgi:hypothetical protein